MAVGELIGNMLNPILRDNHRYIYKEENIIYLITLMFKNKKVLSVFEIMNICYNAQENYIKDNFKEKYNFNNFILEMEEEEWPQK
jgi:hypothetical protein